MIDKLEESGADVVHLSPANHFPTGIVMPVTRRLELFEWVNRIRKRYIIEDDYDSEFRYTGRFILPLYAQDTQSRVIYMNTFSKRPGSLAAHQLHGAAAASAGAL